MFVGSELTRKDLEKKAAGDGAETDEQEDKSPAAIAGSNGSVHPQYREAKVGWLNRALRPTRAPLESVRRLIVEIGRFFAALGALVETRSTVDRLCQTTDALSQALSKLQAEVAELHEHQRETDRALLGIRQTAAGASSLLDALSTSFNARISAIAASHLAPRTLTAGAEVASPLVSSIYTAIEDAFRGTRSDISRRQSIYLPDIQAAISRSQSNIVLDLGCGRGEWLELLGSNGIGAIGVDLNAGQLAEARSRGLATAEGDALEFMAGQQTNRFAAVTAFHIAEHLPFDVLALWIVEAYRVLAPGGALFIETPNPANVVVGASSFHLDPTHNKPLPVELLSILVRSTGFTDLQSQFLHPHDNLKDALERVPPNIAYLLFGYQDYALIAIKPKT